MIGVSDVVVFVCLLSDVVVVNLRRIVVKTEMFPLFVVCFLWKKRRKHTFFIVAMFLKARKVID